MRRRRADNTTLIDCPRSVSETVLYTRFWFTIMLLSIRWRVRLFYFIFFFFLPRQGEQIRTAIRAPVGITPDRFILADGDGLGGGGRLGLISIRFCLDKRSLVSIIPINRSDGDSHNCLEYNYSARLSISLFVSIIFCFSFYSFERPYWTMAVERWAGQNILSLPSKYHNLQQ